MNRSSSTVILPNPAAFHGVDVLRQPTGTLDLAQRKELTTLTGLVRLVHDLLIAFTERYTAFPQVGETQSRESALLHTLLDRYGLPDGDAVHVTGHFPAPAWQAEYDQLLTLGFADRSAALAVIAETLHRVHGVLDAALPRMRAPDVHLAYLELYAATLRQEQAVQQWRGR